MVFEKHARRTLLQQNVRERREGDKCALIHGEVWCRRQWFKNLRVEHRFRKQWRRGHVYENPVQIGFRIIHWCNW